MFQTIQFASKSHSPNLDPFKKHNNSEKELCLLPLIFHDKHAKQSWVQKAEDRWKKKTIKSAKALRTEKNSWMSISSVKDTKAQNGSTCHHHPYTLQVGGGRRDIHFKAFSAPLKLSPPCSQLSGSIDVGRSNQWPIGGRESQHHPLPGCHSSRGPVSTVPCC